MIRQFIATRLIRAGAGLLDPKQLATEFSLTGTQRGLALQIMVPGVMAVVPKPASVEPGCTPCEAMARAKQAEAAAAGIHPEVTHETPGPEAAEAVATKTTTFTVPRDDARALFGAYAERKVIEWRKSRGVWQPWQYDEPDTQPTLAAARWQDEEIAWQVPAQTQYTVPYKLLVAQPDDSGAPVVHALHPELFALLLTDKTDSVFYYDWQEPIIDRSITLWLKDRRVTPVKGRK